VAFALSVSYLTLQPADPIIVRIVDPPTDPAGLREILVGALGLTAVMVLLAAVAGLVLAGVIRWFRSRSARRATLPSAGAGNA
jgi:hypothetical protein